MPRSAYTSPKARPLSARQQYRLLHARRPAEAHLSARLHTAQQQITTGHAALRPLLNATSDIEGDWIDMRERQLLLVVGTVCRAGDRMDLWRSIYEAWAEVPQPDGEVALLDELAAAARADQI